MLTEADKKWLKDREEFCIEHNGYFCRHCCHATMDYDGSFICDIPQFGRESEDLGFCPVYFYEPTDSYVPKLNSLLDAAEFEARVAAKLAMAFCPNYCDNLDANDCAISDCALYTKRNACRLKHARLTVEEEMDA
jgi:hypothetical protein